MSNNAEHVEGCHCGRSRPFSQCCEPVINGLSPATTAETLMRSRYTAFATRAIDYLMSSHHSDTALHSDRAELLESMEGCEWLSLRIINTSAGLSDDDRGEVEFIASYRQHGQLGLLHENSRFIREHGRWLYYDGDLFETAADSEKKKVGRNDPCHCGSGKKFKKCCGQ